MKRPIVEPVAGILAAACVIVSPCVLANSAADADGSVQVLTTLQLSPTTLAADATTLKANSTTLNVPGWQFGSQAGGSLLVSKTTPPPVSGDGPYALEAVYPVATTGANYTWANYNVASLHTEDVYIEFWAKMPDAKEGCKFLKIFGERSDPEGDADTTFAPDYTGGDHGGFFDVGFGDGTTIRNDFQNVIRLDGADPRWIGRSYGIAKVLTPQMSDWPSSNWGTSWHHFRIHVKFNSGTSAANEVPDGQVYVEIDGKVYVDATGLYNRNPANGPIQFVQFGGWAQTDPQPFDVWFDNIRISTGGFGSSDPAPGAPLDVQAR